MARVRNKTTGAIFQATPRLLKLAEDRKDLEVLPDPEPEADESQDDTEPDGGTDQDSEPQGGDTEPGADDTDTDDDPEPDADDDSGDDAGSEPDIKDLIERTRGKAKIHSLILENYGVDLDQRKKLETLKAEALQIIAEHED